MLVRLAYSALALTVALWACPARAAQGYDNCTGFIDTLPAAITAPGTWCLRKHLDTSISAGKAIDIRTNNVTIDCNDFNVTGQGAGAATQTIGIAASSRLNVTVRRCNVLGFVIGLRLGGQDGADHVVEDNRFDGNFYWGINVEGKRAIVRRNLVRNTTGSIHFNQYAYGIHTKGNVDVLDNIVDGVRAYSAAGATTYPAGIFAQSNNAASITGNRVRGVTAPSGGAAQGIVSLGTFGIVRDNSVTGPGLAAVGAEPGFAIKCDATRKTVIAGNYINGFRGTMQNCVDGGGNAQ